MTNRHQSRTAVERDLRGPKMMAAAILAFFACSILAIHLRYLPEAPSPTGLAPPGPAFVPSSSPPKGEGSIDVPVAAPPGLAAAAPVEGSSAERERSSSECIERTLQGQGPGHDGVRPTPPRRWPPLRRALEVRRLEARAACERELVPAGLE